MNRLQYAWRGLLGLPVYYDAPKPPAEVEWQCPECDSFDFTPGGPTVRVSASGARTAGQVLSCLGCGARWYNTRGGLKRPHESALPPAWAMQDLQGRAAKAQADAQAARQQRVTGAPPTEKRGPMAGFRKPPQHEPS